MGEEEIQVHPRLKIALYRWLEGKGAIEGRTVNKTIVQILNLQWERWKIDQKKKQKQTDGTAQNAV